ncbi:hypothetical protein TRFO_26699 [Tritrichomonas foetus]|uniref:CLASP N-terminal domain-containing protein n=1 Tax=Tritrichomonas foetus TaxID=1144522 RepID=A0A1J4K7V6_9EUKA|nr:hypothetical protein TRFO_26699 [Tritrichomonas foetus]|eukprot:OHT05509.1 hypothetical protein TRFO_26699 [Tritrichomonas foetus]
MMCERRVDSVETKKLMEQFENPFDIVEEEIIDSPSDAETLIQEIEYKLRNREDWSIRAEGLKLAISCLKGGIDNYYQTDYSFIASEVAACVSDLRSALVRTGSLLVAASAQVFQDRYVTSIKIIIPALFKQLTHGTAVISNSCHFALMSIARYVQHPKTLNLFLSKILSRCNQHKATVAEALHVILSSWPSSLMLALRPQISNAFNIMKDDASQTVRKIARSGISLLKGENVPESNDCQNSLRKSSYTPKSGRNNENGCDNIKRIPATTRLSKNTKPIKKHVLIPTKKQFNESPKETPMEKDEDLIEYSPIKAIKTPDFHQSIPMDSPSPACSPAVNTPNRRKQQLNSQKGQQTITPSVKFVKSSIHSRSATPTKRAATPTTPKREPPLDVSSKSSIRSSTKSSIKSSKSADIETSNIQSSIASNMISTNKSPTSTPKRQVKKTLSSYSKMVIKRKPVQPDPFDNEIDSYMPPKTMGDAESFQECLTELIDNERFDKFDGLEDVLCPSIIAAANFIPQVEEWETILPPLFENFPDNFREEIMPLIIAFRCNEWLILTSIEYFGSKMLIDEFSSCRSTQYQYAFKFFCVIISHHIDFEMNDKMNKFLKRLVEFNRGSEGAEIIGDLVGNKPSSSSDQTVEVIVMKLKARTDCSDDADKLNSRLIANPQMIPQVQEYLFEELKPLIEEGNNGQRFVTYNFIERLTAVSFVYLVEPLLNLISTEDRELQEQTVSCLLNLMNDKAIFSMVLNLYFEQETDEKEELVLTLISKFFQASSPLILEKYLPETFNQLSPLLDSDTTVIRRIAVIIFVEFKFKIPKQFGKYSKKISSKHQKIIELYLTKRKQAAQNV